MLMLLLRLRLQLQSILPTFSLCHGDIIYIQDDWRPTIYFGVLLDIDDDMTVACTIFNEWLHNQSIQQQQQQEKENKMFDYYLLLIQQPLFAINAQHSDGFSSFLINEQFANGHEHISLNGEKISFDTTNRFEFISIDKIKLLNDFNFYFQM